MTREQLKHARAGRKEDARLIQRVLRIGPTALSPLRVAREPQHLALFIRAFEVQAAAREIDRAFRVVALIELEACVFRQVATGTAVLLQSSTVEGFHSVDVVTLLEQPQESVVRIPMRT